MKLIFLKLSFIALIISLFSYKPQNNIDEVLIFSKTKGFRHKSIEKGTEAIKKLGEQNNFRVTVTEDSSFFKYQNLKKFKTIIFLSPTGKNLFNDQQKEVLEKYIHKGGGFVGIHAATDSNYEWEWYGKMVGAYFASHPKIQEAKLEVKNNRHQSTSHLGEIWTHTDEWYNYKNFNPNVNILINLDEKSYTGGKMGASHPIAWYHEFEGGRVFYTGLGHTDESYANADFLKHLSGGINYALGR
jgi:type 1 glutamine amidotransferase